MSENDYTLIAAKLEAEEAASGIDSKSAETVLPPDARNDVANKHAVQFIVSCRERGQHLANKSLRLLEEGDWLIAAMNARGLIETAGIFKLFISKYDWRASRADRKKLVEKFMFASKAFTDQSRTVHVNDGLRQLSVEFSDVDRIYGILCEAVHPNWLGVRRFFVSNIETETARTEEKYAYLVILKGVVVGCHAIAGDTFRS